MGGLKSVTPRFFGAAIRRKEDPRFITGTGSYLDDIKLPKMLYAAFVRSPYAHAKIKRIDVGDAVRSSKVVAYLTGEEVARLSRPLAITQNIPGLRIPNHYPLAVGKARFVGDPLVALAVEDRYSVEDIIEKVSVEYEPLEAVANMESASRNGAPLIHEGYGDNVAFDWKYNGGDVERAFREADYVFEDEFTVSRQMGFPIEPRAVMASFDQFSNYLTVWSTTQFPHQLRTELSRMLGFQQQNMRVVAPDVGGGFGSKIDVYSEEAIVPLLAIKAKRPVKWVATRSEDFQSTVHAREQEHGVQAAFKKDGTLLGIKSRIRADLGAYLQFFGVAPVIVCAVNVPGAYRLQNYSVDVKCYFTNKVPYGSYRGFGQPKACLVIERSLEEAARELKLDPAGVRKKNLIRKEDFPYHSITGLTYDSGNYHEALEIGLKAINYDSLRKEQVRLRERGRHIGIGIACYSEHTGYAPSSYVAKIGVQHGGYESAEVKVDPSGGVIVATGASPHGQGLETTLAQVCADELGIDIEKVKVIHSDTSRTPYSVGTLGSRGAVTAGGSVMLASRKIRDKAVKIAAHMLEARPEDVELEGGRAFVKGAAQKGIAFEEIAAAAYLAHDLPKGLEPGLEASHYFDPEGLVFSFSIHLAVVEVDVTTGKVEFRKYFVVHDCGKVINPLIVDGQIHGGTAQGIAGALLESLIYNDEGQFLTSTLMDYTIPTSLDIPNIESAHMETPSPITPGGMKGMGEGGTIASFAATANAVADALRPFEVRVNQLPLTPEVIWKIINHS